VTEQAFDPALNPIQARVDLGLEVMSYLELKDDNLGTGAYMAAMVEREVLAGLNLANSALNLLSGLIPI
jgi:hypothetical protein